MHTHLYRAFITITYDKMDEKNKTHLHYNTSIFSRTTAEEKRLIQLAAQRDNRTLSGWLRIRAVNIAREELGLVSSEDLIRQVSAIK